jgi:hypothetical protein
MSNATVTDADIRIQIEQYLAAGESPQDFDVEAILIDVMEIVRDRNLPGISGIDGEVFARIVQRHDTSTSADHSDRERAIRDLYALVEFLSANPQLPAPRYITVGIRLGSLEQVQDQAVRFGTTEYGSLQEDGRPQADFRPPGVKGDLRITLSAPR